MDGITAVPEINAANTAPGGIPVEGTFTEIPFVALEAPAARLPSDSGSGVAFVSAVEAGINAQVICVIVTLLYAAVPWLIK